MFDFAWDHQFRDALEQLVGHNPAVRAALAACVQLHTVKLLPLFTVLVYCWFRDEDWRGRICVINALLAIAVALAVSRLAQDLLPARVRPLQQARLDDTGLDLGRVSDQWSSFPSDHAALAFAVAVGVLYYSRRLGVLCLSWALFVVTIPRVIVGLHYPSDVAAGALIGVVSSIAVNAAASRADKRYYSALARGVRRWPGLFAAGGFVALFTLTTMAEDVRLVGRMLAKSLLN